MPIDTGMQRAQARTREGGFTIIEVTMAAFILLVGMVGALTLITSSSNVLTRDNQRVTATNLARELVENARVVDYDTLINIPSTARMVAAMQALPNMGSTVGGTWQIKRRGTTYTVTPSACLYDDPSDNLMASHAGLGYCSNVADAPTGNSTYKPDANGDDFRRVTFTLSWRGPRGSSRSLTQPVMVANPSGGLGPRIISFPSLTIGRAQSSTTTASFLVTASTNANSIVWNSDDGTSHPDVTSATSVSSTQSTWTLNWPLGAASDPTGILDGTYQLTAQAIDALGVAGDTKVATLTLDRRQPFAPGSFAGGHDTRDGDILDFDWTPNRERDVVGYRIYYEGADGAIGGTGANADTLVCSKDQFASSCTISTGVPSGAGKYFIKAVDATGEGDALEFGVGAPGTRPSTPVGLQMPTAGNLQWNPPGSGSVAFYRIYRGGTAIANRVGRTSGMTWADSDPPVHGQTYYVTAVDSKYNESDPAGPVTVP